MERYIKKGMEKYLSEEHHPWHMPGHKRKAKTDNNTVDFAIDYAKTLDVTEVLGADDLHHPEFMIKDSLNELKNIYGTYASYYLINGATSGIHAAITACCRERNNICNEDEFDIIVASNCHKSVYNIVELLNLKPYIMQIGRMNVDNIPGICGSVSPEDVEKVCKSINNVKAMIITSPTYEGVVSDIYAIKNVLQKYDIALIVDEAHGAHFPFINEIPESAINKGADLVIQSLHKTLPALTQTAILHVNNRIYDEKVRKYLSVFMSSSPSYMLLCSMEQAIYEAYTNNHDRYINNLREFREKTTNLQILNVVQKQHIIKKGAYDYDETRIVISTKKCGITISGVFLEKRLSDIGNIVCEMSGIDYVVLISTFVDGEADFVHLYNTLTKLDNELETLVKEQNVDIATYSLCDDEYEDTLRGLIGTRAKDNIYVYPPGSYIIRYDEIISKENVELLLEYKKSGKAIRGI